MNMNFNTVVEYVKNLFPGRAPVAVSDNPCADAMALSHLAQGGMFFTTASNRISYWYCFIYNAQERNIAKQILRSNGIKFSEHRSNYYRDGSIVLRVRSSYLRKNPNALRFIENVMQHNPIKLDDGVAEKRIAEICAGMKQKTK
ncbi:MAG: hypothetical protein R8M37_00045 [Alphaproteobacteria bacterium]|nr:hypothetical protein [Alphaproteobacteria bacterium]